MHAGAISKLAQTALAILSKSEILSRAYLAGGTALALHLGHRISEDFDFYTREKIRAEDVVTELAKLGKFTTTLLEPPHTISGEFIGIKFSLFRYDYPLIGETSTYKRITIVSLKDAAAMKLSAITGRATKRDYVDIYVLSQLFQLEKMIDWYTQKFGTLGNNLYVIIKALGFFADAEEDSMPKMLKPVSWDEVKLFLKEESQRLGRKYLIEEGKN